MRAKILICRNTNNIYAGGTAKAVKITDRELRLAELIRTNCKPAAARRGRC